MFCKFFQLALIFGILLNISCNNFQKAHQNQLILSQDWQFKNVKDSIWYPAQVPGTVHTDLRNNHLIPEPYYGLNEEKLQWIEQDDWEYRASFDIEKSIFEKNNIELNFKGLDTYADVYLNNHLILHANNMFRNWKVNIKAYAKPKGNILHIIFYSPMKINIPKVDSLAYHLPAGNDRHEKKVSVFVRKAAYQFGWDWAPRFVTFGIWRNIELNAWNLIKINDFQIYQTNLSKEKAKLKAKIEFESSLNKNYTLLLYNGKSLIAQKKIKAHEGKNNFTHYFEIKEPRLWWTNGLGEAYLYRFRVEIKSDQKLLDQKSVRFGIRTVEIVQQPDSIGKSFYFKLNGIPVFMKGANYIPQDNFLPRVDSMRYKKLITDAKSVGMNMLRVWGGGIYENDLFYDLCDENGILVWQDFMFSCSMYPGDSAFINKIKKEAEYNIKRLRNHPSIAIWCGNNEMQIAWERWGYQKTFGYSKQDSIKIYSDYLKIFENLLPKLVNDLDSGRFYWASSPNSAPGGWEEEARSGDMHYWGVWWGKKPFNAYIKFTGRFMSEYGFQSMPALSTIKSFAPDSSMYLISPILKGHNKHPVGFETIKEYMQRDYKVPADFKNFVFMSQILQAEGMKTAIEAHRRAMPYCMGSLYWQLNDCWPVVSWSSIDYYGRWKAFHYYLKKLFAQVLISAVYENNKLDVYLISDLLNKKKVDIEIVLMDFYGQPLWSKKFENNMKGNSSQIVFSEKFDSVLKKYNKNKIFLHVSVFENEDLLSENNLFFSKIKDLMLPHSHIQTNIIKVKGKYGLKIVSDVFAKNIFIDYADDKAAFSDNYFDLLPGEVKTVWFNVSHPDKEINKVHVKSLIERFNVPNLRK